MTARCTIAVLLGGALAACDCGGPSPAPPPPGLEWVFPPEGARLIHLDDVRRDLPGIQVDLVLATTAADTSQVTLAINGAIVHLDPDSARTQQGRIRLRAVSLPAGTVTLDAAVVDARTGLSRRAARTVTALDQAMDCQLRAGGQAIDLAPGVGAGEGIVLTDAHDASSAPGLQADLAVQCRGAAPGSAVRLTVYHTAQGTLDLSGAAFFPGVELGDGGRSIVSVAVQDVAGGASFVGLAPVTVRTERCWARLDPFNARFGHADEEGVIGDASDAPGFQVRAQVLASCPGDATVGKVELLLDGEVAAWGDQATELLATVAAPGSYRAQLRVSASAGPLRTGHSPSFLWEVDPIQPALTFVFPEDGASLGDGDDADPRDGFQLRVRGEAFGLDDGSPVVVELDPPEPAARVETAVFTGPGGTQFFEALLDVENGTHTIRASARRPSGAAAAVLASFSVRFVGGALALDAPRVISSRDDLSPAPGVQARMTVLAVGLDGLFGEVVCGAHVASFLAAPTVPVAITLPDSACAGDRYRCLARVTRASDGWVFESPTVDVLVDNMAPALTLTRPLSGARVAAPWTDVEGSTTCQAEAQTVRVYVNGEAATEAPIIDNVIGLSGVPLPLALNRVEVVALDAHGNSDVEAAQVEVDADPPAPAFEVPSGNPTWTGLDDGSPAPGFQKEIVVRVVNESPGTPVALGILGRVPVSTTTGADRKARATLDLPEGPVTFQACADDGLRAPVCATASATVSTGRPRCSIVFPQDGQVLGPSADADGYPGNGLQIDVQVETETGPGPVSVELWLDQGTSNELRTFAMASGGAVTIGPLPVLEGAHTLDAACSTPSASGAALRNTFRVKLTAPTLSFVSPANGALLTLAVPDAAPAAPGFQTAVTVEGANVAAGDTVRLAVACADGTTDAGAALFGVDGRATFPAATLASEGACTLTARATDAAGNESAPASIAVNVDRVPPTLALRLPRPNGPGGVYNAQDDAVRSTSGFEMSAIEVAIADVADPSAVVLLLDNAPLTLSPAVAPGVVRFYEVPLPQGVHTLRAEGRDASGNLGASASETITIDSQGPSISWYRPTESDRFNRASDGSTEPGFQGTFVFVTLGVQNGTVVRLCTDHAAAASGAPCATPGARELARGRIQNGSATLTGVACAEGAHRFVGEVTDAAGNTSATPERLKVVDTVQPFVRALRALEDTDHNGVVTAEEDSDGAAGARLTFEVALEGVEDGQVVTLRSTLPTMGAALGTALASGGVARVAAQAPEGSHQLWAEVVDAQGNPSSRPGAPIPGDPPLVVPFTVATLRPSAAILWPLGGAALLAGDDVSPEAGMQARVVVQSNGGGGTVLRVYAGAVLAGERTLAAGDARTDVVSALPEGAQVLTATATDLAGNVGQSAPVEVTVDSIPPSVSLGAVPALLAFDADSSLPGFQARFDVSWALSAAGQPLALRSSAQGTVATAATTGPAGTLTLTATLTAGVHVLTATVRDPAGNVATSDAATTTVDTGVPSARFTDPAANPVVWNRADDQGEAPGLQRAVVVQTDGPDGSTAVLFVGGSDAATAIVSGGQAIFALHLADGASTTLQARVTDLLGRAGWSGMVAARVDLTPPVLTRLSPTGSTALYVAAGNPTGIPDLFPGPPLDADFRIRAQGAAGGLAILESDQDGPVWASPVADADTTLTAHAVHLTSGKVHRLTFLLADDAGNTHADSDLLATVDVVAPASIAPVVEVVDRRAGTVKLSWSAPGADGSGGGPAASYEGRRAAAPMNNEDAWTAGTLLAGLPEPAAPGAVQEATLARLPLERVHYLGLRATDAVGNIGNLGPDRTADLLFLRSFASTMGAPALTSLGWWVSAGDLDGDGFGDLVAGAPATASNTGAAEVWYGGDPESGMVRRHLSGAGGSFGYRVAIVNDLGGDERNDLVVSAVTEAGRGVIRIWFGSATRLADDEPPDVRIVGVVTNGLFGRSIAAADLDGDGKAELLVGERAGYGRVRVFRGRASWDGITEAGQADALVVPGDAFTDVQSTPDFGLSLARVGDALGGDAREEVAVSTLKMNKVFVLHGHATAYARAAGGPALVDLSVATHLRTVLREPGGHDARADYPAYQFGFEVAGGQDFDGDGVPDLAVGDPGQNRAWIYSGSALQAGAPLGSSGWFGSKVASFVGLLPDLDGDGKAELAFSHGSAAASSSANTIWILRGRAGPLPPTVVEPDLIIQKGTAEGDVSFGCSFAAGRFDADPYPDLAVGRQAGAGSVQVLR